MFVKLEITGKLEILTGMHIGGSSAFAAIGAVDSPVVRDALTNDPIIPGSSLKGKIRALLARQYNDRIVSSCDDDAPQICRLFGSAKPARRSRLLFRDLPLDNLDDLQEAGLYSATEVKFENGINRLTAVANPRQIERVIRGSVFDFALVYEFHEQDEDEEEAAEIPDDIFLLAEGMKLLQCDYLGGAWFQRLWPGKIHQSGNESGCGKPGPICFGKMPHGACRSVSYGIYGLSAPLFHRCALRKRFAWDQRDIGPGRHVVFRFVSGGGSFIRSGGARHVS